MNVTHRLLVPSIVALSLAGCGGGDDDNSTVAQGSRAGPVSLPQTDLDVMTESSTDYVALLETTFTPPQDQRYTMTATYRATAGGDASVAPYESVKLMCRQQGMNAGGSSYSLSLEPGTKSYILTWEFQLFAGFVTVCGVHGRNAAAPAATVSDIAFTITK